VTKTVREVLATIALLALVLARHDAILRSQKLAR
jgi:hypothetical protein